MAELLIDTMPLTFSLEEAEGRPGKYIFRGQFARSDKPTDNKRLYREHLWQREIKRMSESMAKRSTYGELDHPSDGRTKLVRVSHLLTQLHVKGNEVIGEAEILDTPNGRILKVLADAKASVGVSSRGFGSVKSIADGVQEVQEDFKLDTFDFVADPATKTAYPQLFREEREHIQEAEMELTLSVLKRDYPGLVEEMAGEFGRSGDVASLITEAEDRTARRLKEDFASSIRRGMEVIREEAREEARSEALSDPEIAKAKQVVEQIVGLVKSFGFDAEAHKETMGGGKDASELEGRLADRELEVQAAQRETTEMAEIARRAAYQLHLERAVRDDPSAEAIIALVGDPSQCSSKEEIDQRIETVREELARRGGPLPNENSREETEAALETANAEIAEAKDEAKDWRKKYRDMESKARRAIEIAEAAQLQVYVERKIGGHPKATSLREACEGATDQVSVDRIIKGRTAQRTHDTDEADRIRAAAQGRGKQRDLYEDTHGSKDGGKSPGNGVGNPLEEYGMTGESFDKLAGTDKPS